LENKDKPINVLLAGETYASYNIHIKGLEVLHFGGYQDTAVFFKNAMKKYSDINLVHMPDHMISTDFPKTLEEIKKFDVIIISDIGKYTLLFYPWEKWFGVPMGPDRLELIKEFVAEGGGFIMCGGWVSFQGWGEMARYHGTPIEEVLPVFISDRDDRVEKTEGITPEIIKPEHPIVEGIPPDSFPMFSGYNKLKIKEDATLIAKCAEDPFIAVHSYGNGRTMAFASDIAPHWGAEFIKWEYYSPFWYQSVKWIAKRS